MILQPYWESRTRRLLILIFQAYDIIVISGINGATIFLLSDAYDTIAILGSGSHDTSYSSVRNSFVDPTTS